MKKYDRNPLPPLNDFPFGHSALPDRISPFTGKARGLWVFMTDMVQS